MIIKEKPSVSVALYSWCVCACVRLCLFASLDDDERVLNGKRTPF